MSFDTSDGVMGFVVGGRGSVKMEGLGSLVGLAYGITSGKLGNGVHPF